MKRVLVKQTAAMLFGQVFSRTGETLSGPVPAAIPIVLQSEFDRARVGTLTPGGTPGVRGVSPPGGPGYANGGRRKLQPRRRARARVDRSRNGFSLRPLAPAAARQRRRLRRPDRDHTVIGLITHALETAFYLAAAAVARSDEIVLCGLCVLCGFFCTVST
jgi:hypothetical protein